MTIKINDVYLYPSVYTFLQTDAKMRFLRKFLGKKDDLYTPSPYTYVLWNNFIDHKNKYKMANIIMYNRLNDFAHAPCQNLVSLNFRPRDDGYVNFSHFSIERLLRRKKRKSCGPYERSEKCIKVKYLSEVLFVYTL